MTDTAKPAATEAPAATKKGVKVDAPDTGADLEKVDSAVQGLHLKDAKDAKRRASSAAEPGVMNILDLEAEGVELKLAPETQATGWKINENPSGVDDQEALKLHLTEPPVKRIDLKFPQDGMQLTARNRKGVTIKDALDAIYSKMKKKDDDVLDAPYLKGFEWDKEESWTRVKLHLDTKPATGGGGGGGGGGKKKKGKKDKDEA